MASSHRPSPLRSSDTTWVTSSIIDRPSSTINPRPSSSLDLVPAPRPSDLQIILRTRHHAAYYDPSSNELSLQKRNPSGLESSSSSTDAPLVPHRNGKSGSLLQRFTRSAPLASSSQEAVCPTCARPWNLGAESLDPDFEDRFQPQPSDRESPTFIAPNYFRLLAQATTTDTTDTTANTRPSTPSLPRNRFESASGTSTPIAAASGTSTPPEPIAPTSEAQGYYSRFFVELKRLGRGARGQVYLCQHVLNGNKLGKYAIKKIPVGDHAQNLLESLNEVHLMESLHHPHLIHYQHAWIERCQLSAFAPEVPTLFVLMMAANGGSLADWISARAGDVAAKGEAADEEEQEDEVNTQSDSGMRGSKKDVKKGTGGIEGDEKGVGTPNPADRRKIERLKAALRQRRANRNISSPSPSTHPLPTQPETEVGVHLLRTEELYSLLHDITSGLSFLHDRGILHLDIKPGNVLLHWDEDSLIPRAMLSDFGSSLLLHDNWTRTRSGHTGTMEYMSPETLFPDPHTGRLTELGSKADIWSLGMILHLLLFFRLPFGQTEDVDLLRSEMRGYTGFKRANCSSSDGSVGKGRKGRGDEVLLGLLERMLQVDPGKRPSCKDILQVLAARAEAEEAGEEKRSQRRKKYPAQGEGVSLALYRPTAQPSLPSTTSIEPSSSNTILQTHPSITFLSPSVPPEIAAIAIALLKCLSPFFISHTLPSLRGQSVLPNNAVSTFILLLALVDLALAKVHPRISIFCWIGHFALLLAFFSL